MKYILVLLALTYRLEARTYNVEGFEAFVSTFIAEGRARGRDIRIDNLVIRFGEFPLSSIVGYCGHVFPNNLFDLIFTGKTPVVTISKNFFNEVAITPLQKEVVIFHELGHCILNRGHKLDTLQGIPTSLMYPDQTVSHHYQQYRSEYLDELFRY